MSNIEERGSVSAEAAGFSRRNILASALGIGAGLALAACSGSNPSSNPSPSTGAGGGKPVRGGTVRLGTQTGGSGENLFPGTAAVGADFGRVASLFSPLFFAGFGEKLYPLEPGLALSAEANTDATVWTFHLRQGVTWHNGKPFTADDVVYDLQNWMSDPSSNYGAALLSRVNFKGVRAIDKSTVEIPLTAADAQFPAVFTNFNLYITPAGMTPEQVAKNPIGTGPFKFGSFTPGKQSVFDRNPDYWEAPKPYFDRVVIDSSFTDSNAIVNALLAGSVDIASSLDWTLAAQHKNDPKAVLLQSRSAYAQMVFGMRVDQGQFADVRVRQAFKYLMNRQQIIDGALSGYGEVAYDLIAPGTQFYASDLKRDFDPDKARSLFKAAGVLGDTFVLQTTSIIGLDKAAAVLAQQAKAAGVTVQLKTVSPATYWTPAAQVYNRPFSQDYLFPIPTLSGQYSATLLKDSPFRLTWWGHQQPGGDAANSLILDAIGTVDESKAADKWHAVQQQQFDEGGYLCFGNQPWVDLVSPRLRGVKEAGLLNLNSVRLCDGWFAS